jgi:chromosome segregation ATPase
MSELENEHEGRGVSAVFMGGVVLALLAGIVALGWSYSLQNQLEESKRSLVLAQQQNKDMASALSATNARLTASVEQTSQASQSAIASRAQEIMRRESAETAKLEKQQAAANEQISSVSNQVSAVQTDVGGVKTDVGGVKQDLADTKTQLQSVMGDAHVMSGLIATNHDQLEELKHKGDRNYFEFTLNKNGKPTLLSTISLQLHKVDDKHSKFTLEVSSDDKKIEKKDKTLDEPLQFYSGKDPMLYEIVVNNISKNTVTGYLSTPKNAPQITSPQSQ